MISDFIFELRKGEALVLQSIGCGFDPCERFTLFVLTEPILLFFYYFIIYIVSTETNLLFCCLIVVMMIEMHCTGSAGNIKVPIGIIICGSKSFLKEI